MANEHDNQDRKFTCLYMGVVAANNDPEKLGRVRVRIPGIVEPASAWAFPLGLPASGGKKRGTFAVPPKGAEVGVFFHQGDPDHPYYLGGNYGEGEPPDEVQEASVDEQDLIYSHETKRYKLTIDDRPGKQKLELKDKKTGDQVLIDGAHLGILIQATSAIAIVANGAVSIDAASVTIAGRLVAQNGKPI